ncbi:MAG: hypothetical protein P9M14_01925 [Candidatus Alcyoniella australis]|nr:hypothetical protein [Candidatus Alcyoniella australis]
MRGALLLPLIVLALGIVLCAGCADQADDSGSRGASTDDDDSNDDDDDSGDDDEVQCPNQYCVFEDEDLDADWDCIEQHTCVDDYLTFVQIAAEHGAPVSSEELDQQLEQIELGQVDVLDQLPPGQELGELIVEQANVGFLRQGINQRPLYVTVIRRDQTARYYERELLLADPYVGTFKAILLIPKYKDEPFPAVLALHGHNDAPAVFRDDYGGASYPDHGYAILMLASRAMAGGQSEDLVTRSMLQGGFTLIGVRGYEALLGLKYLQYLEQVDNDGIGLIGHSGGSVAGNLLVRHEPGFKAYVSDCFGEYYAVDNGLLQDETAPALYPYHELINEPESCLTPIYQSPYGFYGEMDQIFQFFDEHLKG